LIDEAFQEMLEPFLVALQNTELSSTERLRQTLRKSMALAHSNTEQYRLVLSLWSQPEMMDPQSGFFPLIERVYEHELLVPLAQVIQEGMGAGEIAPGVVEALAVAITGEIGGCGIPDLATNRPCVR
jgi:hypothetical protein